MVFDIIFDLPYDAEKVRLWKMKKAINIKYHSHNYRNRTLVDKFSIN